LVALIIGFPASAAADQVRIRHQLGSCEDARHQVPPELLALADEAIE
jgi:hypothetical protein